MDMRPEDEGSRQMNDHSDPLTIAGREFRSRLIVGTGKYRTMQEMRDAIDASAAEMVTVAIRRLPLDRPDEENLMDHLDWGKYTILPNTAGCRTADEALFTARLARELTGSTWVKLEVIPDPQYLLPDPVATLEAAGQLIREGFVVLPYIHADPILARRLEEIGCATLMPLGSPEEFVAFIVAERQRWSEVIRKAGIRLEQ